MTEAKASTEVILYTGGYLVLPDKVVKEDLWVQNGVFIDPKSVDFNSDKVIDVSGRLITPGFIDLKLNGCFGVDFSKPSHLDSTKLQECRIKLGEFGVTSFMPCVPSNISSQYHEILPRLSSFVDSSKSGNGAEVFGIHLDGPVHNRKKSPMKSYMDERSEDEITDFYKLVEVYGSLENVGIVSVAPELPGVIANIIPSLIAHNVKVSLAHTVCSIEDAEAAVRGGASIIGHLFNGMPNFHHRDPSLVGLLASSKIVGCPVYFGLIADLVHTHPNSLAMAHKLHPDTLMIVSDAVSALGVTDIKKLNDDVYHHTDELGRKMDIRRSNSRSGIMDVNAMAAYEHGTDRLIGSCTPVSEAIKNLLYYTDCSLLEAISAVTIRPATAIGIDNRKGNLKYGSDADFVTLDQNLNVMSTYTKGERIFKSSGQFFNQENQPRLVRKSSVEEKVNYVIKELVSKF
eukprot:GHVH01011133.1.p1 GENE.GHVH01011133.1~~GHVH01011133.1.p1  ORF type:complete len:458 (+),score=66.32 GHVH01011133.1:154-1527(+)